MILIFCALYPEAQPLIKALQLGQDKNERYYKKYSNDENDICLWITGTGPLSAATAVGYALSSCNSCFDNIHILNFGCCALVRECGDMPSSYDNDAANERYKDKRGSAIAKEPLYLCNKIVNADSGRAFYPDLLLKSDLDEAMIITGSKIFKADDSVDYDDLSNNIDIKRNIDIKGHIDIKRNIDIKRDSDITSNFDNEGNSGVKTECSFSPILYDMEAAAIYESASHFVGPHQMHFLKFVTDQGEGRITADFVREKAGVACPGVVAYLEMLRKHITTCSFLEEEDSADTLRLFEELHASVTMQRQIRQLLQYATVAGIDYRTKLAELRNENILPCKDKRTGLKILEELRDYISCH